MTNGRIYLRAVGDRGKPFRKLDGGFDGDLSIGFWSKDGKTIYFNEGIRATQQLFSIDCDQNEFRPDYAGAGLHHRESGRQDRQDPDQLLGRRRRRRRSSWRRRSSRSPTRRRGSS